MADRFPPHYLVRAHRARAGVCFLCLCTDVWGCPEGCSWEPSTGERLCTAHTDTEKAMALQALTAADREQRRARERRA